MLEIRRGPVLEKASKVVRELILVSAGLGKEIGETVEKVFCRLSGLETPLFQPSPNANTTTDTKITNPSSSSKKRKIDYLNQNQKTTEVPSATNTPSSKSHDSNHKAPSQ